MKKLWIIAAIIVVLFALLIILNNVSTKKKIEGYNPYGTTDLHPLTIELLSDPNYHNIILPKDLEKKIESGEPVLAYMFSPECQHCRHFTPTLMKTAKELDVQIDQLNIFEYKKGWDVYNVEFTPTLIFFKDGKEVNRIVGDYSEQVDKLKEFLEQAKQ